MDNIKKLKMQHLLKIIENESLSRRQFAFKLKIKPSNLSNYCTGVKEVHNTLANQIVNAFPERHYRTEYILGLDEDMTEADYNERITSSFFAAYNDRVDINTSVFRQLAILNGFEVALYDSGVYVDENGMFLNRYLVKNGEETRLMNYQEISDFIEYLSALTVFRINKLFNK